MKPEYGRATSTDKTQSVFSDYYQIDDAYLQRIQGRYSPVSIFFITIAGIAIAEIIAMIVVFNYRELPYYKQVIIDATVMTVIIFPVLYFLSFRPILQHIKQRYQVEQVIQSRLRIIQFANTHTFGEILQFTLDELEALTDSNAGYFHFIEADQKTIELQAWSSNTLENMCRLSGEERHYSLDRAGVWADAIRQRKTVIHNDYSSLPNRRGLPKGHTPVLREMAVPILRDEKIVAVLGVGNKPTEYTSRDVEVISTLADFVWDITLRKQAEHELEERNQKEKILTQNLHTVQLDIARDLHDTLGQNIGYIRMTLEHLNGKESVERTDLQAELQTMSQAANESYELIRGTLAVLQSNNSSDLFLVFSRYAEQIEERSNIQLNFESKGEPKPLTAKRMRQLFYVFREAIANIEKHAEASRVFIYIYWDKNDLRLVVSDDGKGFDIDESMQYDGHYGLRFMKERVELLNGTLNIESALGSGTRLEVMVPYE